jgi:hypothetical protein
MARRGVRAGNVDSLIDGASSTAKDLRLRRAESAQRELKEQVAQLMKELDLSQKRIGIMTQLRDAPAVKARETKPGKMREATAVVMVSDLHLEEVVKPETVNGVNEFNPVIARERMRALAQAICWQVQHERNAFHIREMVMWLGGDIISGYIHEELCESNAMSPIRATLFAKELLLELIRTVRETLGINIHLIGSSGNHGRTTIKTRVSTREDNSFETLLYAGIAESTAADKGITFALPQSILTYQKIYGFLMRYTHGDAVKYGGGVGTVLVPVMKAVAQWDRERQAHHTTMGHWHQRMTCRQVSINGSLVGYGAYSLWIKAGYEPPMQGFYLVDSKRGVTHPADLWVCPSAGLKV